MKQVYAVKAAVIAALAMLVGCNTNPNPNETTPPSIVFNVKDANGHFVPATSATVSGSGASPLNLSCVATDQGGMSSLSLSFSNSVDGCVTPGGAVYTGGYPIAVPATQQQTTTLNSQGQLPSELFFFATMQGPYTCHVPNPPAPPPGNGTPGGSGIVATCVAQNYSKKTATATLPITLN